MALQVEERLLAYSGVCDLLSVRCIQLVKGTKVSGRSVIAEHYQRTFARAWYWIPRTFGNAAVSGMRPEADDG